MLENQKTKIATNFLFIVLYLFLFLLISKTGGLESPFTALYIVLPIGINYATGTSWLSALGIFITVAQVITYYILQVNGSTFIQISGDHYFLEQVFISTFASLSILFMAWKLSKDLDGANKKLIASRTLNSIAILANGMAHEVNNPLCIISMRSANTLQRIKEKKLEAGMMQNQIQGIALATKRISNVIEKLNLITEINAEAPRSRFSLGELIEKNLYRFTSDGVTINPEFSSGSGSSLIEGYSDLIDKCLTELFANARDAAAQSEDKPWINIQLKSKGKFATVTISNSGKKIPEEDQKKIFNPFFTTKEVGKGIGLGLSICRAIVEAHGGSIQYNPHAITPEFILKLPLSGAE